VLENEITHIIRVYRTQLLCESCGFRQNYMKGILSADFRNFTPIFNNPRWLSEHARILPQFLIFEKRFKKNFNHLKFQVHTYKNAHVCVCM